MSHFLKIHLLPKTVLACALWLNTQIPISRSKKATEKPRIYLYICAKGMAQEAVSIKLCKSNM